MANPRKSAASILCKIEKDSAYSNITLGAFLKDTEFTSEDKKLVSALVYGVLDRRITLDYVLSCFMKTPLKKTAPFTLQVLRCALYQIMFMDKIPDSAAVNEAVKLIKGSKENRNSGFVNAVLRSVLRAENLLPEGDSPEALSVRYSCPIAIVKSFIEDYGADNAVSLLEEALKAPPVTLRTNTTKLSTSSLISKLKELDICCEEGDIENSVVLTKGIDIGNNELYKKGFFHVQDYASQRAVAVLNPKPYERVLDICAAPGGKSFTMAELMENKGELIACDLYEHKTALINKSAKRLGLDIIKTKVSNGEIYNSDLGEFDAVLCDVPCSGLGVIRRKPEIKYKPIDDFSELEEIQYKILENAVKYLKRGGRILYSTCTLRKGENEKMIEKFLSAHKEFVKEYEHTFMPHIDKTDGFYCALIFKR